MLPRQGKVGEFALFTFEVGKNTERVTTFKLLILDFGRYKNRSKTHTFDPPCTIPTINNIGVDLMSTIKL